MVVTIVHGVTAVTSDATIGTVTNIATGTGLTGGPITSSGTISLVTPVTVPSGGTGQTSLASQAIIVGSGTNPVVATGITIDTNNALRGFIGSGNFQVGTTYTVSSADAGKFITFNTVTGCAVTLVSTLATGFGFLAVQAASGQCTFTNGTGATLVNRSAQFKTAGQYAVASLLVIANSGGSAAQCVLGGDTTT